MSDQESVLQIIVISGEAKSCAYEAIEQARGRDFDKARKTLEDAKGRLVQAHQLQTDMIISSSGQVQSADMLTVHAQDHLMCASTVIDLASELCRIYEAMP